MSSWITTGLRAFRIQPGRSLAVVAQRRHYTAEVEAKETTQPPLEKPLTPQPPPTAPSPSSTESSDKLMIATVSEDKKDKLFKVLEIEALAYEPSVLDSYQWFVLTAASHLGIKIGQCWAPLKSNKLRFQMLKSAFVHKKHQVHYEVRTHHRFFTFHKLTSSTADTFLEYIERNLPEGVGLKVTKVEAKPIPEYLRKPPEV